MATSAKTFWKPTFISEPTSRMNIVTTVGIRFGRSIRQSRFHFDEPSIFAASYWSWLTEPSAAMYTMVPQPVDC